MERSQWYIGTPNGIVLCVDRAGERQLVGRAYHAYSRGALEIANVEQLLFEMERFYDWIDFPHPANNSRTFQGEIPHTSQRTGREKIMNDGELLSKHGDLGTFIIRVQHRQNSSWQGRITWMDKDKTVYFRSMWEMLKLIDSALDTGSSSKNDMDSPAWPE